MGFALSNSPTKKLSFLDLRAEIGDAKDTAGVSDTAAALFGSRLNDPETAPDRRLLRHDRVIR